MAVKLIEDTGFGQLGLWEITESVDQLLELLNPKIEELTGFVHFRHEGRRKEWLATRLLVKKMRGHNTEIGYYSDGKPRLLNLHGNISISHASGFVAIYYHPNFQPGIDIEPISRNVIRVANKFLSLEELKDCNFENQLSNKELVLRWCAKEAVFKMVPYSEIDFGSQIACKAKPLNTNEGKMSATFKTSDISVEIPLNFRLINDLLIVWGYLEN